MIHYVQIHDYTPLYVSRQTNQLISSKLESPLVVTCVQLTFTMFFPLCKTGHWDLVSIDENAILKKSVSSSLRLKLFFPVMVDKTTGGLKDPLVGYSSYFFVRNCVPLTSMTKFRNALNTVPSVGSSMRKINPAGISPVL